MRQKSLVYRKATPQEPGPISRVRQKRQDLLVTHSPNRLSSLYTAVLASVFLLCTAQTLPAQTNFVDQGDGTILDNSTGLVWQKSPGPGTYTWEESAAYAKRLKLGGKSDWRLPTMKELFSIADFRGNMRTRTPYINTDFFEFEYPDPHTGVREMDAQFWSSNRYLGTTMRGDQGAFGFNFADGRIKAYPIQFGNLRGRNPRPGVSKYVRCVRGKAFGENDFKDQGDGTILDRSTGLLWMKQDSDKPMDWQSAKSFANDLVFAGHADWRLPTVHELQGIVDYSRAPDAKKKAARGPAIDPVFELTDPASWAWTITTHLEHRNGAFYVAFGKALSASLWKGKKVDAHGAGAVRSDPKAGNPADWPNGLGPQQDEIRIFNYVRCVRAGPS